MKIEAFLAINIVYFAISLPLMTIIFCVFRFLLKNSNINLADIFFLFGGVAYWIVYTIDDYTSFSQGKTLANFASETGCIGIGCAVLFLARCCLAKFNPNKARIYSLVSGLILVIGIILVYCFVPPIPE